MMMRQKARARKCLNHKRYVNTGSVGFTSRTGTRSYRSDRFGIAQQDPQLNDGETSHPSDGEEADPFDTDRGTQAKSRGNQPKPPVGFESLLGTLFVLIGETSPGQGRESSKDDERRVKQNQTRLCE